MFAGTGLGVEHSHKHWREDGFAEDYMLGQTESHWHKVRDVILGSDRRDNRSVWFASKGGFIVYPTRRFGVRFEFHIARYNNGLRSSVACHIKQCSRPTRGDYLSDRTSSTCSCGTPRAQL